MAYPLERAHKEWLDYQIRAQENGEEALSFEEWRKKKQEEDDEENSKDVKTTTVRDYAN